MWPPLTAPATPPSDFRLGYRPALDGLRAFAILSVMAFHASVSFARGGFLGVDLFFVLSGFLITTLLLEEQRASGAIRLGRFYARRALRLLPALVLVLIGCAAWAVLDPSVTPRPITGRGAAAVLLYAANWVRGFRLFDLGYMDHAWSLAIEEQFYLLWPPLLLLLLRRRVPPRVLLALIAAGAAASAGARALLYDGHDARRVYSCLDTRADALLVGCAASVAVHAGLLRLRGRAATVLLFAALAAGALFALLITRTALRDPIYYRGGLTVVAIASAVLIVALLVPGSPLARLFELAPLVWIGKISYGLYLWHFPAFHMIGGEGMPAAVALSARVGLTFAIATASYYLLERPLRRLGRG